MSGNFVIKTEATNRIIKTEGVDIEKRRSFFSRLASHISGVKNSVINFFSGKKLSDPIENPVDLEEINRNKKLENEREGLSRLNNKQFAIDLKKSIEKSSLQFPEEKLYESFDKRDNSQKQDVQLSDKLWISASAPIQDPLLENEVNSEHGNYTYSSYFHSISNKNSFNS